MSSTLSSPEYHVSFIDSIHELSAEHWHALSGRDYPFLRHEFLAALEDSRCTCTLTGWTPHHLLIHRSGNKAPVALLPLYIKHHSYGEYVFDWSWADAYQRHGLDYYPKLLSAIPFTPAAGPRFCSTSTENRQALLALAVKALQEEAERLGASSWHLLFPEEEESQQLDQLQVRQRRGCQYHWIDQGYESFDGLLAAFSSRKRKMVRKERAAVSARGIHFQVLEGEAITPEIWEQFYHFYANTYAVRGRPPYLNRGFFQQLGTTMPEHLVMVLATPEEGNGREAIAGALSFRGEDCLYGRYWGALQEVEHLHFETCYYQGIDYCLANGLKRFDSGAQGEHKIQRGFTPVTTWSNHWLAHPAFNAAIEHFLQEEAQHISGYQQHASDFLPFRKS